MNAMFTGVVRGKLASPRSSAPAVICGTATAPAQVLNRRVPCIYHMMLLPVGLNALDLFTFCLVLLLFSSCKRGAPSIHLSINQSGRIGMDRVGVTCSARSATIITYHGWALGHSHHGPSSKK